MLPPLLWVDQGQALPLRGRRLHLLQRGLALPDELVAAPTVAVKHLQAGMVGQVRLGRRAPAASQLDVWAAAAAAAAAAHTPLAAVGDARRSCTARPWPPCRVSRSG